LPLFVRIRCLPSRPLQNHTHVHPVLITISKHPFTLSHTSSLHHSRFFVLPTASVSVPFTQCSWPHNSRNAQAIRQIRPNETFQFVQLPSFPRVWPVVSCASHHHHCCHPKMFSLETYLTPINNTHNYVRVRAGLMSEIPVNWTFWTGLCALYNTQPADFPDPVTQQEWQG